MMRSPYLKYIVIIFVSLMVIGGSVYHLLGGFEELNVYEMEGGPRVVIGKAFSGKSNHPDVNAHFREAQAMILDSLIMGTLVRVYDVIDSPDNEEVNYFIGVLIDREMAEVPSGFAVKEYFPRKRFAVFLKMNKWVRPSARTIDRMISEAAVSAGHATPDKIVEIYYLDDSMSVEGWIF